MDLENLKKSLKGFIDGGSVIAYITFLGYLFAFIYQLSYLSYFGLDENFIELDIVKVLFTCFLISIFLLPVSLFFAFLIKKYNSPIWKIRVVILLACFLLAITFLISDKNLIPIYGFLPFLGFLLLYNEVIGPLHYGKRLSGWKNKQIEYEKALKKTEENNVVKPQKNPYTFLKSFLEDKHIIFICLTIVFIATSFILGNEAAKLKNQFYVLNTSPEQLVLLKTSEGFVTVTYDRSINEFKADYKILRFDYLNQNNISMHLEAIKSLKQPKILREMDSLK